MFRNIHMKHIYRLITCALILLSMWCLTSFAQNGRSVEAVRQEVIDHYTALWEPGGVYVSFSAEDQKSGNEITFVLRSDAAKSANGGFGSANTLVTFICADTATGRVYDLDGYAAPWYLSGGEISSGKQTVTAGWQQDAYGWWYRNADGSYPTLQWMQDADGKWYHFNQDGYMQTG